MNSLETKVKKVLEAEEIRKKRAHENRALVVDDSAIIRKIVSNMLLQSGFFTDVLVAEDGDIAIEIFPKYKFDLVILDWEMPRVQGIDVLKEIRKKDKKTPIIMATGKTEDKFKAAGLTPVKSDVVNAPFIEEFPLILQYPVIR